MKRKLLLIALVALSVSSVNAQGLLGKLKKKVSNNSSKVENTKNTNSGESLAEDTTEAFTDEYGYSGKYYSTEAFAFSNSSKQKTKEHTWKFVREENGNVVNKVHRYVAGNEIYPSFFLDEKAKEKGNMVIFKMEGGILAVQLEEGVFGVAKVDEYKGLVTQYINTYAKDKAMLETYDKETGAAVMQSQLDKLKSVKIDVERTKWMKNETYAKMKGKIGFMDHYSKVAYNRGDITEKVDVFMSSVEIGKSSIFYRAYYETPGGILCSGCELNTTFEINGVKVSRAEQRKVSSKWSRTIKQKFVNDDFFSAAPIMISYQENIADYAFLYAIYQNKDKFVDGASIPVKVTITTNQDGVDKDVLAESTLTLVYKNSNKAGFDKLIKWVDDLLEE